MGLLSRCALNLKIVVMHERLRNVQSSKTHVLSYCSANEIFCFATFSLLSRLWFFFFSKSLSVKSKFVEPKKRKISRKATLPLNSLTLLLENVHASGKPSDPEQNHAKELVHILRKFKVKN